MKTWRLLSATCALLAMALISNQVRAVETPALQKASPEDQQAFAKIKDALLAEAAKPPLILTENQEVYFWLMNVRT